jgi:hypothetical protein
MLEIIDLLNNNKVLWGVTMLMLNVGSRYVVADLGKFHESVLSNEYVKKIIVFCMFFVATRDVTTAFLLTVLYILVIDGIFHEKRKFCIVPKKYKDASTASSASPTVTEQQYLQAKKIVLDFENAATKVKTNEQQQDEYNKYAENIKLLNSKTI